MPGETIRGTALAWRMQAATVFEGRREGRDGDFTMVGSMRWEPPTSNINRLDEPTYAESDSTPFLEWKSTIPSDLVGRIAVIEDAGPEPRVAFDKRLSPYRFYAFDYRERGEDVQYVGTFGAPFRTRFHFDVFTDPEPIALVVLVLLAVGCYYGWVRSGGVASCNQQHQALSGQCIEMGGSPRITAKQTLGVSWSSGFSLGCNIQCEFECVQPVRGVWTPKPV